MFTVFQMRTIISLKQSFFACVSPLSIHIAHDVFDLSENAGDLTQLTQSAGKDAVMQDDSTLGKSYQYKGCLFPDFMFENPSLHQHQFVYKRKKHNSPHKTCLTYALRATAPLVYHAELQFAVF